MSFSTLYRVSFYAMLLFATLVLSVDVADIDYAMIYPAGVAVAAATAFLTVDRDRTPALSNTSMNLLALLTFPLAAIEYFVSEQDILILALGHWLVFLQVILMFRPKRVLEDWELFLLGLVQVLVGTVVGQGDTVGIMLLLWAILSLWVLGLFSLRRDALRARGAGPGAVDQGEAADDLYPRLLNVPFLLSGLRVMLTTLALGGVIFLAMPRRPGSGRPSGFDNSSQHLTGFDEEVRLGQFGEILENDEVVMSIELFDERGGRVAPDREALWRGVTMSRYEEGRWFRQFRRSTTFPILNSNFPTGRGPARRPRTVRQVIKLEANDTNVLFGLRPMIDVVAGRRFGPDWLNTVDGTIARNDVRAGTFDYEVKSFLDPDLPQPGEVRPDAYARDFRLLGLPDEARPRLQAIAQREIARRIPVKRRDDARSKARALEAYLRESGAFTYTLKIEVKDASLDPVVDFLVNRKEGHCEYFASALALLLRSVGVPTRVVNGFKGGDWNDLAEVMSVRQKHAHSWVEAYLGTDDSTEHYPIWLTLDPTPGTARDRSVALVGGFREHFRQVTDLIRYVWVFYVVGYNTDRQNRLVYQPIRNLVNEARRGFEIMGRTVADGLQWLRGMLHFESPESLISWRGFVVSFVVLLALAGLARGTVWVVMRLLRRLRGQGEEAIALAAGEAHYRRLAQLLAGYGLERPPAETQEEYARRATVFLTARGSNTEAVADVPRLIVDAFYRVRFGHRVLSPATLDSLETRLDALEANLLVTRA